MSKAIRLLLCLAATSVLAAAPSLVFAADKPAASAPAAVTEKEEYLAFYFDGKKAGYGHNTRSDANGLITTTAVVILTVSRGDTEITLKTKEIAVETPSGKPVSFQTIQVMGGLRTVTEGAIGRDGKLTVTTRAGDNVHKQEMAWPAGALLSEGMDLLQRRNGLREGTAYAAKVFEPSALQALDANVSVGPRRNVDILGRVVPLTEVVLTMKTGVGHIVMTNYVNDNFDILKMTIPLMGMKVEGLACDKAFALSPNDTVDFLDKGLLTSPKPLENIASAKAVRYTLQAAQGAKLNFVSSPDQTVAQEPNGIWTVTVHPASWPAGAKFPYAGKDPNVLPFLAPTRYLQCDDPKVIALAKKAVGDATDAAEAARRIEKFVNQYITKKDLNVGYASASEVVDSREGDCTEHAVLAAALCRAVGIPSQVADGMAYVPAFGDRKDVFGPHAWTRAFLGDRWVSLDATFGRFDAGHIALSAGNGDPGDFFDSISTFGYFKIADAHVER